MLHAEYRAVNLYQVYGVSEQEESVRHLRTQEEGQYSQSPHQRFVLWFRGSLDLGYAIQIIMARFLVGLIAAFPPLSLPVSPL